MKIYSTFGAAILSITSTQAMSGSLTIQELPTTTETGDFPVCFNGSGELLPCYEPEPKPPPVDPYSGGWTGIMTYNRSSTDTCYDADVSMSVNGTNVSSMVVRVTGVKPNILPTESYIPSNGFVSFISHINAIYTCAYAAATFCPFDNKSDFILQFTLNGSASGEWQEQDYDCYGTWLFTKD